MGVFNMIENKILKRNITYRLRNIANKNILFSSDQTFELNEIALFIWNNLDGKNTVEDLVNLISKNCDASIEIIEKDLKVFMTDMITYQVILEVE